MAKVRLVWAVITMAFNGSFRVHELLSREEHKFDPSSTLLAKNVTSEMVKEGGKSWFFIVADYAFGHALEADTSNAVKGAGGEVLGSVRAPR